MNLCICIIIQIIIQFKHLILKKKIKCLSNYRLKIYRFKTVYFFFFMLIESTRGTSVSNIKLILVLNYNYSTVSYLEPKLKNMVLMILK